MEIVRDHLARALAQIKPSYTLGSVRPLSRRAALLCVRSPAGDGEQLVALWHSQRDRRRHPDIARVEFRLLGALKGAGLPVADALYLADDHTPPYLVASHIPGEPRFAAADLPALPRILAKILSEIHAFDLDRQDLSFLPRQADLVTEYLVAASPADERVRSAMRRAADRAAANASALLHGDFWLGNLLWQGETLSGIIDWEDAMLGDPLADLGKSRLEMLWALGEAAMREYSAHYLALNPQLDSSALPFWDLWGAARLAHFASFAAGGDALERMRAQYDGFVEAALEALQK